MLYLDSSALVKRYLRGRGTDLLEPRFHRGEKIFTSALSYAEIQAALARKWRKQEIERTDFLEARKKFVRDWVFSLNVVDLETRIMTAVPDLVEQYPLRGSDAVHLSTAIWLRDMSSLGFDFVGSERALEFGVADRALARAARELGLTVFNPEASS